MLTQINEVKKRIDARSQKTRTEYLKKIEIWKTKSPNRNNLGC